MFVTDLATPYEKLATLIEVLRWRALNQPDQHAYTFLSHGESEEGNINYAQLDQKARTIAAILQQHRMKGKCALLLYPSGIEYIAAFMGCMYAGVIAIPAYPPSSNRSLGRIQSIVSDSGASIVLSTEQFSTKVQHWSKNLPERLTLQWISTETQPEHLADLWEPYHPETQEVAFLQYTSGSTGTPRGVMVSHQNLMHNLAGIRREGELSPSSVGISWLPMFHDMGLILGILQSLYTGFPTILMAPAAFIQHPLRWLQAITKYRGTISSAPNFAYNLCCDMITAEDRLQLDLSSWKLAPNGAEPISAETLTSFYNTFAPCGLSQNTLTPVYGLAEGTLLASSSPLHSPAMVTRFDNLAIEQHRVVPINHTPEQVEGKAIVSCGSSLADQQLVIVNPETLCQCQKDEIGEIWIKGASVAQGYWKKPEETAKTFQAYLAESKQGPFLRTGDLGFLLQGELFVTGRLKDMIIIRGNNYYPQDIEQTATQSHPSLRPGCSAAFSINVANEERLVIIQELQRHYKEPDLIIKAIRQCIAKQHEIHAYAVVLIRYGSIFKTTSGKIQRSTCRKAFLANEMHVLASDVIETTSITQIPEDRALSTLLDQREEVTLEQKKIFLANLITEQIRYVLSLAPDYPLPVQENLLALGMDSLSAVRLMNRIQAQIGIEISSTLVFTMNEPTIERLSQHLLDEISTSSAPLKPVVGEVAFKDWLDEVATLSEKSTEECLRQQLASITGDETLF